MLTLHYLLDVWRSRRGFHGMELEILVGCEPCCWGHTGPGESKGWLQLMQTRVDILWWEVLQLNPLFGVSRTSR